MNKRALIVGTLAISLFGAFERGQSQSGINIAPTRLTLSTSAASGTLTVVNQNTTTVRYRLSLVDMAMSDEGVLAASPTTPENSALKLIRFAPREIKLAPGEMQKVRVIATFPAGLASGEYRSHIAFEPIEEGSANPKQSDGNGHLRLDLRMRTAVTLPVFLHNGDLKASASILAAKVVTVDGTRKIEVKLKRDGGRTTRGTCLVLFIPTKGSPIQLAKAIDVPVYFPNKGRSLQLGLERKLEGLGAGFVEASYSEPGTPVSTVRVQVE